ncbi:hypothetical protein SAMN04488539_0376 [Corynebacterium timonense]|uniref:Uncharacterized protein n=2 Tax=Corynebacterium timonense TaxID=441500 RepID=A0A1H1LYN7_9CORY|nr:hypothetical protein SAMN04488539_0376 [Corynebacterium timonense]
MARSMPSGSSQRIRFADLKPYAVPDTFDSISGPATGTLALPHSIRWLPEPARRVPLGNAPLRREAYKEVLNEGNVEQQIALLNRDHLINDWPHLILPARVRALWENKFPELAAGHA